MESTKILVVDDDPQLRAVMAQKLTQWGYDVQTAADGASALELVRAYPYKLAVLDYQMPGLNGIEFFQLARRISPQLMGVFVTAHARIDTVYSAVDAGMSRVLAKPVNFVELAEILETCLAETPAGDNGSSGTSDSR